MEFVSSRSVRSDCSASHGSCIFCDVGAITLVMVSSVSMSTSDEGGDGGLRRGAAEKLPGGKIDDDVPVVFDCKDVEAEDRLSELDT